MIRFLENDYGGEKIFKIRSSDQYPLDAFQVSLVEFESIMGLCLDTDKKDESDRLHGRLGWRTEAHHSRDAASSENGPFEGGHVRFVSPKVPVIFVLGGPGSGKVTHCESLAEEKRGIVHINMTDLLQQHTLGNDGIKDFNQLSSKIVAEALMLEIKMSPAAKIILISGYPRNMRDVVEYTNKIKVVSGVILIAWNESSLERQIEYGAKLGHVVLSLARMELNNFYKNVIPVADFYDQRGVLVRIVGERSPQEVYNEFRVAVLRIIGTREARDPISMVPPNNGRQLNESQTSETSSTVAVSVHDPPLSGYPTVIYILGGSGSNKADLIRKVLRRIKQWSHISVGELLREAVDSKQLTTEESTNLRRTIAAGELVDDRIVMQLLDRALMANINSNGVIIDGYPRSISQLEMFEKKYNQHPRTILLDCLQYRQRRWDDSIQAFRKRLEVFDKSTRPVVNVLETEHRLRKVDGDTALPEVQKQFTLDLLETIEHAQKDYLAAHDESLRPGNYANFEAATLQDVEGEMLDPITSSTPETDGSSINGYGPPRNLARSSLQGANVISVSHANFNNDRGFALPTENTTQALTEKVTKTK